MLRTLPYIAALAIVIVSGIIHGAWTDRGPDSRSPGDHAVDLRLVPKTLGEWEGRDSSLDRRMIEMAEIDDYLMRTYINRSGQAVTILLVCGRPGPIAVHTPEICYAGSGFVQTAPSAKLDRSSGLPEEADGFWRVDFSKQRSVLPESLRILYAWSDGGHWRAADRPRLEFASSPDLYKLYVIRQMHGAKEHLPEDPSVQFLRLLLPELGKRTAPAERAAG